jgi:hypothetical protein
MDTSTGKEQRLAFWGRNLDSARVALAQVEGRFRSDHMLVMADFRDPYARAIIVSLAKDSGEDVEKHSQATLDQNRISTVFLVTAIVGVRAALRAYNPVSYLALAHPSQPKHIWVAVMAEGGVLLIQTHIRPLVAIGQA